MILLVKFNMHKASIVMILGEFASNKVPEVCYLLSDVCTV